MVVPVKKIFGSVSILMACTKKKVFNYWISTKCNKLVTTSFLYETIIKYRRKRKSKILDIFLDNATMHYSKEIKMLAEKLGVYLFFNAPYSSKINLVEYVFEKLKRRIRRQVDKRDRVPLKDVLFKEMAYFIKNREKVHTDIFYDELKKALEKRNMWTRNQSNGRESLKEYKCGIDPFTFDDRLQERFAGTEWDFN